MRQALAVATTMALLGCGGLAGNTLCPQLGVGPVTTERGLRVDCAALDANLSRADDICADYGIATSDEFWAAMGNVEIHFRGEYIWESGAYGPVLGYYEPGRMVLGRDAQALLHEFLHHLEASRGWIFTGSHAGWESNGFNSADIEFQRRLFTPIYDE